MKNWVEGLLPCLKLECPSIHAGEGRLERHSWGNGSLLAAVSIKKRISRELAGEAAPGKRK